MIEKKVVPITGKHTTFSSLAAEAMVRPEAKRGFIVFFEEETARCILVSWARSVPMSVWR